MQTLDRAAKAREAVGYRLILPWREMNERVSLRTKELVIMAGAPGGGKTTVAVNMAMGMDVPMLYCAQDSPASVLSRLAALALGEETDRMYNQLADERREQVAARLADTRPTLVFSRGRKTIEQIADSIDALTEWIGRAPSVVFIDNMIDLIVPGTTHGDMTFYTSALPLLKELANTRNCCMIVLHHVTRGGSSEHGKGNTRIGLNDLLFAGEREARHVWGFYNDTKDRIFWQILKNQDGPADPSGHLQVPLQWYPKLTKLASMR